MSSTIRTQLITKLFKIAKKHFAPVTPIASRSVLDHMLYACCLENSPDVAADEAFARLEQDFFDWNEVRVTTTSELAESMKGLTQPEVAAASLKKTLHGVFETWYKFDLDFLKKENLRKTVDQLNRFRGVSPFVASYSVQVALGGHFIPLDQAMMDLFLVLGIITDAEAEKGRIPGLERTIAKNKGIEFSSVVHQLAAALFKAPQNKEIRAIVLSIAPDAKDRFQKRGGKKKQDLPEAEVVAPALEESTRPIKARKGSKASAQPATSKLETKKSEKKTRDAKPAKVKTAAAKTAVPKKKPAAPAARASKTTKKKTIVRKVGRPPKKSATRSLARKKPR